VHGAGVDVAVGGVVAAPRSSWDRAGWVTAVGADAEQAWRRAGDAAEMITVTTL
jgi:hypothetical protein